MRIKPVANSRAITHESDARVEWQRDLGEAERAFHGGHQIGFVQLVAGTSFIEIVRAVMFATAGKYPTLRRRCAL